jgi:radical SAM superfamily enzyme YgiQ (UPF0313 family)
MFVLAEMVLVGEQEICMSHAQRVLLVVPRFNGQSFWNYRDACELVGARLPSAPLGLITVAALLPDSWECRLINRNTEELNQTDIEWADLVMTGGMLPQRPDTLEVITLAQQRSKPVIVGGPDVTSSPAAYKKADFRVLGEAEGIIEEFISAWGRGERSGVFEAEKFAIDVTKTPMPRFDLLKRSQYLYLGIQFSRGCPFTCEFCDIIELYGRVPRTKTAEQVLGELDALYSTGYRGHVDFVDDNFIGNKKAVKAFLPHLIRWQKERRYPFMFSTEASANLSDDDVLLGLMREANFFAIFVGIETPDLDTLVAIQKKQNTRRDLVEGMQKIYRAGIFVNAGFILGFDSEKGSVADAMIACIEEGAIPVCMVGLLYALPTTQLTKRLAREGRLFPESYVDELAASGSDDQCTAGLNFSTIRPRRDILSDYKAVLQHIYEPRVYFQRVLRMALALDRPRFNSDGPTPISVRDLWILGRLVVRMGVKQPRALWEFIKCFVLCARAEPDSLQSVATMAAMYLHLGPFSRFVIENLDRQISEIDRGAYRSPLGKASEPRAREPIGLIA